MSASLQEKLDRTARLVEPVLHKILDEIDEETKATDYNGWANRSTWNVALWINNDEFMYEEAVRFMKKEENIHAKHPYKSFILDYGLQSEKTPDGIKFLSNNLDYKALNEMMLELVQ